MRISIKMMLMGVAVLMAATPLYAQRQQSLAERVSHLEQQIQGNTAQRSQANTELLEQLLQLRSEVQALRGAIERLEYENEQLKQSNRVQYLDIDIRLNRLEGTDTPPRAVQGVLPALPKALSETPQQPNGIVAHIAATPTSAPAQPEYKNTESRDLTDEHAAYNLAFEVLKNGDYTQSAQLFLDFLQTYPNGTYAPNALYWLGESYYAAGDYATAQTQFNALIQRYPKHDKAAGGLLKLALSQLGQGNLQQAEAMLTQVASRFPGSDAAKTAQERLQTLNLNSVIR